MCSSDLRGARTAPNWLNEDVKAQYRNVWQQGLTGALNYYRASPLRPSPVLAQLVIPPELLNVSLPTLVLWGMGDIALPPGLLDGLQDYVPKLQIERTDGATHWIIHEQPALVAQHLQSYLIA